jgi:hypothetical protein
MATGAQFMAYVRGVLPGEMTNGVFNTVYQLKNGRSQMAMVSVIGDKNVGEWACIESPVGVINEVDVVDLLQVARQITFCGGIVASGGFLLLRDTFPLDDLQEDEFLKPFAAVTTFADILERRYSRNDRL